MRTLVRTLFILCTFSATVYAQTLIRVPQDQPTIQAGINAASDGDTILVAEGTYFENVIIAKKIVLGSYYIIDGDTTHISRTIVDGSTPANQDSATVITITTGSDTTTIVAGLRIQKGAGTYGVGIYGPYRFGGGINANAGVTIKNNLIIDNSIVGNEAVGGAGIAISPISAPVFYAIVDSNVIVNNTATCMNAAKGAEGGVYFTANGRLTNNIVKSNSAGGAGYGIGGGISVGSGIVTISGNFIQGNYALRLGGGVVIYGFSQVSMYNNIIVQNVVDRWGGGIGQDGSSTLTLANNTIALNYSGTHGAGLAKFGHNLSTFQSTSTLRGMNNIFWNRGPWSNEIYGAGFESLYNNLIRGESSCGEANFSADPLFIDTVSFALVSGSPCIAAGIESKMIQGVNVTAPVTDYLNAARPRAGGTAPDIGAIESDFTISGTGTNRAEAGKFQFNGVTRYYILIRPTTDFAGKLMPVLINLHGYLDDAQVQMNYTQIHLYGDTAGFVTVYPQAFGLRWNSGISANPSFPTPNVNDVGFLQALIDTLDMRGDPKIDRDKVFVCGMSNGGFMSLRFAAEHATSIRGVASVAGSITNTVVTLTPSRPVPTLLIHGNGDDIVPYQGSQYWYSVDATVDFWRTKNNCLAASDSIDIETANDNSTVTKYTFPSATDPTKVVLFKVINGGHTWPGGAPYSMQQGIISRDINANREIVEFFKTYGMITGVRRIEGPMLNSFSLSQNYPNPFNPSTAIKYQLPSQSTVTLTVYDMLGRVVEVLVNEKQQAGVYQAKWDATVASGVYFYRLEATGVNGERFIEMRKMVLVR